jgi:hypothetical protein
MTRTTARRTASALMLAVALAAFPAIYASARTDASSGDRTGRMMGGCGEMMNGGTADGGMMSGRQADRGMMGGGMIGGGIMGGGMMSGGDRPNQQWRR